MKRTREQEWYRQVSIGGICDRNPKKCRFSREHSCVAYTNVWCFFSFVLSNHNHIMQRVGLEAMPEQTTDGFHVMRAFWKRVREWDCHCPYLWRLCLFITKNQTHTSEEKNDFSLFFHFSAKDSLVNSLICLK